MAATVHAIVLIAVLVGGIAALLALKRRVPTSKQLLLATLLVVVGLVVAPCHHMCNEGDPVNQWLLPAPLLFLTLAFIGSNLWRRIVSACVFVGMLGLSWHFVDLVHEPGWTGNPDNDAGAAAILKSFQSEAARLADRSGPAVITSEGWLRDQPFWAESVKRAGDERAPPRRIVGRAWHTALTRLYPYTTVQQGLWCPAGRLDEVAARIELRDRPEN